VPTFNDFQRLLRDRESLSHTKLQNRGNAADNKAQRLPE
jgi:hypothetical protein